MVSFKARGRKPTVEKQHMTSSGDAYDLVQDLCRRLREAWVLNHPAPGCALKVAVRQDLRQQLGGSGLLPARVAAVNAP